MRKLALITTVLLFGIVMFAGCGGFGKKELPKVPEQAKELAVSQIRQYKKVSDAAVVINKDKISLAIVVNQPVSKEKAKELGENFARILASMVAFTNDNLEGPIKDTLGGLYDYYTLHIGVATDLDNFIMQGAKVTSSKHITW